MLKKIALSALFAITFAVGMGAAQARVLQNSRRPTACAPAADCCTLPAQSRHS